MQKNIIERLIEKSFNFMDAVSIFSIVNNLNLICFDAMLNLILSSLKDNSSNKVRDVINSFKPILTFLFHLQSGSPFCSQIQSA